MTAQPGFAATTRRRTAEFGSKPASAVPVAVIGASCRLPGGITSATRLWDFLRTGGDAVGAAPADRWHDAEPVGDPTRRPAWFGGFLEGDIGGFDAEYFGISHREADLIDPQHRLLLEVAWEACEHAGLPTANLAGTSTGVFVGMCNVDYATHSSWLPDGGGAYFMTGNQFGSAAGRVSHLLGLRGPSIGLDTSCSSGLVAAHLASQSLQVGECDLAIAGAVNLLLSPRVFSSYNELGVLSPTGKSRSFDERADGYVRAEGCVALVLKRLPDAVRDDDRILAVLRGTAVNHDGSTSRFTRPSGLAQQEVFRAALARAGVDAAAVGMIEAHGTGTPTGDSIELASLTSVYGSGPGRCALGSVKSNLGHTEAAAGMVGLLKAILSVYHGEVPGSLHFRRMPSGAEPVGRLFVPKQITRWPLVGRSRLAAVCSYGVGGTNAHAIVEGPPSSTRHAASPGSTEDADARPRTFLLSAHSLTALETSASKLVEWLAGPGAAAPLGDVAHTLALRRTHAAERLAVIARSRPELVSGLSAYVDGKVDRMVVFGMRRGAKAPRLAWVFSGHGSQWPGMGRDLLREDPVFAATVAEIEPTVRAESGFSPYELLRSGACADRVDRVQPLIFTMQVALARSLLAKGVKPAAVAGHSMGEVAAAVVAGGLSLADGAKVICRRSLLCVPQAESGIGAMATVELGAAEVDHEIAGLPTVDVAVLAAPNSTVIGGTATEVRRLLAQWDARGVPARLVAVDFASHCALTEPLAHMLENSLDDLRPQRPKIPFYTTVLPDPRSVPVFDGAYWGQNMRRPVRAVAATTALAEDGYLLFQEISPHPVATRPLTTTLDHLGTTKANVLPSLHANQGDIEDLNAAIAALHCSGYTIQWKRWYANGRLADVPTTSWDRRRHLIDMKAAKPGTSPAPAAVETLAAPPEDSGEPDQSAVRDLRVEFKAAPSSAARRSLVEKHLEGQLRVLLGLRTRHVDHEAVFSDLGLDSLHAVRLRNTIQDAWAVPIPLAAIWKNPTLGALSRYLCDELGRIPLESVQVPDKVAAGHVRVKARHQSAFISLPAGEFHYLHWGKAGPAVVLLHANAGSAATWSRVGTALADQFHVFALDLRGHGASNTPQATSYSLRAAADDVADFLGALSLPPPLLIGHSWGAAVALVLASGAETDRPTPGLSGLVLEDPPAAFSAELLENRLNGLDDVLSLPEETRRETLLALYPDWDETDRESLLEGWQQASGALARKLVDHGSVSGPLLPLLTRLTVPTLLIRADPRCGGLLSDDDWAAARTLVPPGSTTLDLPGAGHEIHRSQFECFISAVRQFATHSVDANMPQRAGRTGSEHHR